MSNYVFFVQCLCIIMALMSCDIGFNIIFLLLLYPVRRRLHLGVDKRCTPECNHARDSSYTNEIGVFQHYYDCSTCRNTEERGLSGIHETTSRRRRARGHFGDARVSRDRRPASVGVMATQRWRHRRVVARLRDVADQRHVLFEDQTRSAAPCRPIQVHGHQRSRHVHYQRTCQRHLWVSHSN